ncbi:MAG: peptidylprolyl isomerase [Weeksellaceae bacterium]|jgi:peptidyl-prolyl cis-trans isomerase SurA|nr:peptidylprolyl isomerase [Weeksellaceae bacterium]MDX9705328.1 peptidylprolyl isomerase [Weeksellaceae bacterium]
MKNKLKVLLLSVMTMISVKGWAQPTDPNPLNQFKIDGVAAVVGDEIILNSDIERDFIQAKAQGLKIENNCEFLENILVEKLLLSKAKEDTLIKITNEQVDRNTDQRIQFFLSQGSEKDILEYFGYTTMPELKQDIKGIVRDQAYVEEKQRSISQGIDATPEEVREFYEKYKLELPDVPEEVGLSHLVMYPEILPENEEKVVRELAEYKREIEEGASFATKAILYSNDPGSASNGGLIQNVKRGQMVSEFDAVAFNLQEGEISEPFKTDFGYHIILLEKRRGQELDLRHILIQLKPTAEEITATKQKLDSIMIRVDKGEITFKEAVYRYSVDKYTKYNGGKMTDEKTGEDRLDRSKLPIKLKSSIEGLNDGEISQVFEDQFNNQKVLRVVRLEETIPAHKINLETDYARLKNFTVSTKRQEAVTKWVAEQINDTFVSINPEFNDCEFRLNWQKKD